MTTRHVNKAKKVVADVMDGSGIDIRSTEKIPGGCEKCEHPRALFHTMQTRSADEAATIYYECENKECGFKWTVEP
jgi:DNA-directed RNA polymerase III subunit RPC11